jgi:integrase
MAILIRKNKAGKPRYRVCVRDSLGAIYPTKTFGILRDAKHYERDLQDKKDKKYQAISILKRNIEVHRYVAEWLLYRKQNLSVGWYKKVSHMTNAYVLPFIGTMKLGEVAPTYVGNILGNMKRKGLKDQTRLHVYNILNKLFKDAIEYFGYLEKNPVLKMDKPKVYRIERNFLRPEDAFKLLAHCKEHYLGPAVWLGVLAGLRPSETQALQWRSVDFEKGQILVCSSFNRSEGSIQPHPKQKDWLIVPMPKMLSNYLLSHKVRFPLGFVAPALRGGMLDYSKFYRELKKLCLSVAVKAVTPHELRHSCTEIWFHHGATLEDVRRLLGHKSSETTRRYVHKTDDRLIEIAKEITI